MLISSMIHPGGRLYIYNIGPPIGRDFHVLCFVHYSVLKMYKINSGQCWERDLYRHQGRKSRRAAESLVAVTGQRPISLATGKQTILVNRKRIA